MNSKLHSMFRPVQANGRVPFFRYVEISPSPPLRPYISCYWAYEPAFERLGTADKVLPDGCIDRVLPDGCTDILFEHDLTQHRYRIRYCGIFNHPFPIAYDIRRPVRNFGVRFFPGGAYALLKIPMAEFANRHFALDDLCPKMAKELGERIFGETSLQGKVRILETYFLSFLKAEKSAFDGLMANLLYRIFVFNGNVSVQELAESEAISPRQMNRKFARWIGVSPKKFCEIVRFQAVFGEMLNKRNADELTLAFHHGFFDQAHFIRDFKRFYGASPTAAKKEIEKTSDFYNRFFT